MECDSAEQHVGQMDSDNQSESDPDLESDPELESQSESDNESNAANEPISEGSKVNQLDVAVTLLNWFSKYPGVSKAAVSELLQLIQKLMSLAMAAEVRFPTSFKQARKMVRPYLTESKSYQICSNECISYTGEHSKSTHCPKCGEERVKSTSYSVVPLIPRLKKIFRCPSLAKLVKYHAVRGEEREEDDIVFDIHDTEFWRDMFSNGGPLDGDPRNVLLSFSADPVQPFKVTNPKYSMCPISLQILNFPKPLRSADNRMLLWSILPGPNRPRSLSAYLRPLVDELLVLKDGIEAFDSDSGQSFTLKARCVLNVLDYEGQQMFLDCLGPNAYQGCNKCRQPGTYLSNISKMVYSDSRRFLPSDHPLRSFTPTNVQRFPFRAEESRPPPQARTQESQHQYGIAYENARANGVNETTLKKVAKSTGVKGRHMQ